MTGFAYKYDNRDLSYRRYYVRDYFFENFEVPPIDGVALLFFNPLDRAVKFSFTPGKSHLGYTRHKLGWRPCVGVWLGVIYDAHYTWWCAYVGV